jgi:hypothetical protein
VDGVVIEGYTLGLTCDAKGSPVSMGLTLSYGAQFSIAGGGVKGSTPFSFEHDGVSGVNSSYTLLTDTSTGDGSGQFEFEAGHFGSAANVIGQLGYGLHIVGGLAICVVFGSIAPTQ